MADSTHVEIIGLGKMGGNMRERMRAKGLTVTGYDPNREVSDVAKLSDLVDALPSPRVIKAVAALRNQFGGHSVRKS